MHPILYYIVLSVFGSAIYTDQFPDINYVKLLLEASMFYFVYAYPATFVVSKYSHSINVKLISFFLSFGVLVSVAARAFVSLEERDDLILLDGVGGLLGLLACSRFWHWQQTVSAVRTLTVGGRLVVEAPS